MKKIKIHSELVYILSILMLSFAVAMITTTNFGVSMIVAPAYILSQKVGVITFGQSEYIIQGLLFIVFCILMKKVKIVYFCSFVTCLLYGACLDFWRIVIPHFNPNVTAPGTLPLWLRIVYFIVGMVLTSASVALFFQTYLYPQVYDFFVKGVSAHFKRDRTKFKICFDITCLVVSCVMTLILFHKFVGVGVGTIIMTCCNGALIGAFGKLYDKNLNVVPLFNKFSKHFDFK